MGRKSKTNAEAGARLCSVCKKELPVSAFYKSKRKGYQSRCKLCSRRGVIEWQKKFAEKANAKSNKWKQAHKDQVLSYQAVYREENRDKIRSYGRAYMQRRRAAMSPRELQRCYRSRDLQRYYGITIEEYDAMLIAQSGRCAICGEPVGPKRALAVDHCHKTGKVRGLLCGHCNPLLHKLEADADWMQKAVDYLKNYQ